MTIREYCLNLLQECGCKQDCYKRSKVINVMCDLAQYVRQDNIRLPYLVYDVAKTLVELGNEVPDPAPAKWHMAWSTEWDGDGFSCDSFDNAKGSAFCMLETWMCECIPQSREDWDTMIYECYVKVYKRRDDIPDDMRTDRYDQNHADWDDVWEEYWEPSQEELNEIGWMLFEDMPEEMQKEYTKYWDSCAKEEEGHDD